MQCTQCGKIFKRSDNFETHQSLHGFGYDCPVCHKPHTSQTNLDIHWQRQHQVSLTGAGVAFTPTWQLIKEREAKSSKFARTSFLYTAQCTNISDVSPTEENVSSLLTSLVGNLTEGLPETDYIKLSLISPSLDFPITLPYTKIRDWNVAQVFTFLQKKLNSNEDFRIDNNLKIELTHVVVPTGEGKRKAGNSSGPAKKKRSGGVPVSRYSTMAQAKKQKDSVINILNKGNSLCCASAIVLAIERYKKFLKPKEEENTYQQCRNANRSINPTGVKAFLAAARKLHTDAGVPEGPCGPAELAKFQAVLPRYQIKVYLAATKRELIFKGNESDRTIYLVLDENLQHYDVITGPAGFFGYDYYCDPCEKGYWSKTKHCCDEICQCCYTKHDRSQKSQYLLCSECNRTFWDQHCMDSHKKLEGKAKIPLCALIKRCEKCGQSGSPNGHVCGIPCPHCHIKYTDKSSHRCYMEVKHIKPDKEKNFIFYDIESMLVGLEGSKYNCEHIPNLLVSHRVCQPCADKPKDNCTICCQKVFKGTECVSDFIAWIFSENLNSTVIAHNLSSYDGLFILRELSIQGKSPDIIPRGSRILEITVPSTKVRFVDSLNFIPAPLSKLPKMFNLMELKKGYFPYKLNTPENQNLPTLPNYPPKELFCPDNMPGCFSEKTGELSGGIKDFETWYESIKDQPFDLLKELLEYCISDVTILKEACLRFRKDFMSETKIDPFITNITLSQVCMDFYKSTYLKPNTIPIIPPQGYHNEERQSEIALKWLKYVESELGHSIVKKGNNGEKKIGQFRVDGFDSETNTVYEFLGDYWHGNLDVFSSDTLNKTLNLKMGDLNDMTMARLTTIKSQGYNVVTMWESDFKKLAPEFIKQCEVVSPLKPRDAFFGGRTNGIRLKYDIKPGEKIKYYDFCSLYPFIIKYGKFPIGDPEITTSNFKNINEYYGLVKCKVLPPTDLYMPVLPTRLTSGKLVFPLCSTCASQCQKTTCEHMPGERALVGTWTTDEIQKALAVGYEIITLYEVWDFPESSQYDHTSHTGGLFTGYIDKFFKLKLQYSGWPDGCVSESEKDAYIDSIFEREGIKLKKEDIEINSGLRALAKLMLNSFWGKFGQKANLSKKKIVKTREQFLSIITDETLVVESDVAINDETLMVTYKQKDEFVEGSSSTNVVIAAFTTSQARLKLYDLISQLGDRVCYFDTDSVFWIDRPGESIPPLGHFLGDLTSELPPGRHIVSFACGGPKNYAYVLDDFDKNGMRSKCVIKGISMKFSNCQIVTFNKMSAKITAYVENGDSTPETFYKTDSHFYRAPDLKIYMRDLVKSYKIMYDKRVIVDDYNTVPYGHSMI